MTDGTGGERETGDAQSEVPGFFPATRWTLVLRMQDPASTGIAVNALNELCQIYWRPVYAYIRSWRKIPADAEDLTQGFFQMILGKRSLDGVAPDKGKLRTFLLVALNRFLANEHHRSQALKRGGGNQPISIDAAWTEGWEPAVDHSSPEKAFERVWAMTVLDRALSNVRRTYIDDGKDAVFDALKFTISPGGAKRPLAEVAGELGLTEGAAKVAAHRLRSRYRRSLQEVISEIIGPEESVEEEIRYLTGVFRQS